MYVFDGRGVLFAHADPATGAHASFGEVLALAVARASAKSV
jgi:hypothetical protein